MAWVVIRGLAFVVLVQVMDLQVFVLYLGLYPLVV